MIKSISFILLLLLVVNSCTSEQQNILPLNTGNPVIANALKEKLNKEGIWYKEIDEITLEMSSPVPVQILEFLTAEGKKLLPDGRNRSWPKPMFMEIKNELDKNSIG